MFDNLNALVTEAGADVDSAFDTAPDTTKKKIEKGLPEKKDDKSKTNPPAPKGKPVIEKTTPAFSNDDDALSAFSDDEDDSTNDADKDKEGEEVTTDNEEEITEDTDNEEEDEEVTEEPDDDTKDFLKARVNLLIKKGEWADFEGSEEMEWDEDSFADMEIQQRAYQKQVMRDELLDSFGPYGKEIADYVSKGGNPDTLIDIFKEQQRVEALSITTEDEQRAVVMKYETEFLNKKPERVKKYIDSLIADKDLEDVAKEAKASMEEHLQGQTEALQAEQDAIIAKNAQKAKENIQKFQSDITSLVNKSDDIPADEKKQLLQVLTKFDKKLKNGQSVNEFYFKFDQFRKDLPNYLKLVRLVLNPDKFIKGVENKGKNEANDKLFNLARSANKSKKAKAANEAQSTGKVTTKFKLLN